MNKWIIAMTAIVSSLIIGLSIVAGFYILGESLHPTVTTSNHIKDNKIMNKDQVADYLTLSSENIDTIIQKDLAFKRSMGGGTYNTYQFLPYFKTPSGQILFLKEEVDQWLTYQTQNAVNS